jgi:hypothetical protein
LKRPYITVPPIIRHALFLKPEVALLKQLKFFFGGGIQTLKNQLWINASTNRQLKINNDGLTPKRIIHFPIKSLLQHRITNSHFFAIIKFFVPVWISLIS